MKRNVVLVGIGFLLIGLVGCGSNSRDALVNRDINVIDGAAAQLGVVRDKVNEALDKSAKEKRALTGDDLKPAVQAAAALKDVGKAMQKLKEQTDALTDSITKEEREELAQRFKARLQGAMVSLVKSQQEMDQAIRKAEDKGPKQAVVELKKTLELAQSEFGVLAKQQ